MKRDALCHRVIVFHAQTQLNLTVRSVYEYMVSIDCTLVSFGHSRADFLVPLPLVLTMPATLEVSASSQSDGKCIYTVNDCQNS